MSLYAKDVGVFKPYTLKDVSNGLIHNIASLTFNDNRIRINTDFNTPKVKTQVKNKSIYVTSNQMISSVAVYNLIGQKIFENSNLKSKLTTINLEAKPKGVYIIKLTIGSITRVKKIVLK